MCVCARERERKREREREKSKTANKTTTNRNTEQILAQSKVGQSQWNKITSSATVITAPVKLGHS